MSDIKKVYIEEAQDVLERLEEVCLNITAETATSSDINAMFRALHTLKGNSSMFGYTKIADFVHELETIYDQIRSGDKKIVNELIDLTLNAVDLLRVIIFDDQLKEGTNQEDFDSLFRQTLSFQNGGEQIKVSSDKTEVKSKAKISSWYLTIKNIKESGFKALSIFEDLKELGKLKVILNWGEQLSSGNFDPLVLDLEWVVLLETETELEKIKEAFIFVDNSVQIEINVIGDYPIFENEDFIKEIEKRQLDHKQIPFNEVVEFFKKEEEKTTELKDKKTAATSSKTASNTIRVETQKLDGLMNLVSELVTTQAQLSLLAENSEDSQLEILSESVENLSRQLREIAFELNLLPIKSIIPRFKRLVREASKSLNKNINFVVKGEDTEIDKSIIENLAEPLIHLLRNSIDHGIESPEERRQAGKDEFGTISLEAYSTSDAVYILIKDDGKGIAKEKVKNKAIDKGLIEPGQELSDQEIFDLIFLPGFSTSESVTEISGRGVGMDAVKRNIQSFNGNVSMDSEEGKGTTIKVRLPLSLSIIDGLLVQVGGEKYIIPLQEVEKCIQEKYENLENKFNDLIIFEDKQVPFLNLRNEFNIQSEKPEKAYLILIKSEGELFSIAVDQILNDIQAVLKPLGSHYKGSNYFSGSAVLGDGSVAILLDVRKVIEYFKLNTEITNR